MKKLVFFSIAILFCSLNLFSQTSGDFRTNAAAVTWNTTVNWQTYNGTSWLTATASPTAVSSVYVQAGHVVTLTQNESCKNLFISTGTLDSITGGDAQVKVSNFVLSIDGKLSCYYGPVRTLTNSNLLLIPSAYTPSDPVLKAANSSTGRMKFTGNTRSITVAGEWGTNLTGKITTFDIELALNPGQTATMETSFKAYNWIVTSGTLNTGVFRLAANNGTAGLANVTISSGSTLVSAATGVSNQVISRDSNSRMGILTINGSLKLMGAAPSIDANSIVNNGTILFSRAGDQTMISTGGDISSAFFDTYMNIYLMNSGTKTSIAGRTYTLNGTISICGTTLFAKGVSSSVTYATDAIINYNGTSPQVTSNNEFPSIGPPANIIINNPTGVTLHASRTIVGSIQFLSGNFILGSNNLTFAPGVIVSGGSEAGFVSTNGAGHLTRLGVSASSFVTFPIGNGTYTPVTIGNTTGPVENFSARVQNTIDNSPPGMPGHTVLKQWDLSEGTTGGNTVSIELYWSAGDEDLSFNKYSDLLFVGHWNGSTYDTPPAELLLDGFGLIYGAGLNDWTTFSPFIVADDVALPVELSSFTSFLTGRDVRLNWATNTETNNSGFDIERKDHELNSWTKVGNVQGAGTSATMKNYEYTDRSLLSGKYDYRLKQIDINGNFKYYELNTFIDVTLPKVFSISQNYPNPFNPVTKIDYDLPMDSKVNISVYDMTGRMIKEIVNTQQAAGNYTVGFDGSAFSSGMYFYRINATGTGQNFEKTSKMILIK